MPAGLEDIGGAAYLSFGGFGFYEAPAGVSWGSNRIDVFVRGTNSELYHLVWQ